MAEVLLDAVSSVTDVPTNFDSISFPGADNQKTSFYPKGTRALQLYDSAVASYFLKAFGRNDREITCECERSNEPSMIQVLHLCNGDTINQKLGTKENRISKLLKESDSKKVVEEAFLLAFSRFPTESESEKLTELLNTDNESERRIAIEDLFWSLISSREFLFNH